MVTSVADLELGHISGIKKLALVVRFGSIEQPRLASGA